MSERSPLLQRGILALLSSEIISSLGSQMTFLALPWFVLTTTGSTTRMGIVLAAELLPMALLGIPSGVVVSRTRSAADDARLHLARVPLMMSIPILYSAGLLSFGLLLVLVFMLGVFIAPYFSAQRLVLPELVGEDQTVLTQANAVVEAGSRLTILLGPITAGLLIAWIGATNVLYVDAASNAICSCSCSRRRRGARRCPSRKATAASSPVRFIFADSLLRPMMLTVIFLHMFSQAIFISMPVLAYRHYGASAHTAGFLIAAFGAGSVIGALAAIPLAKRVSPIRLATVGIVWVSAPLLLLGVAMPSIGVMGVLFAAGLGAVATSPIMALLTTRAPDELRAKVMTAVITIVTISGPLTVLVVGRLLESAPCAHTALGARNRACGHGGRIRGDHPAASDDAGAGGAGGGGSVSPQ